MDGIGLVIRRAFLRVAAPALFLVAVTAAVLLVRSATRPGAAAVVPTQTAPRQEVANYRPPARRLYYRVQPNDTLGAIAARFHTTVHRLQLLNPGVNTYALAPGQRLRVR